MLQRRLGSFAQSRYRLINDRGHVHFSFSRGRTSGPSVRLFIISIDTPPGWTMRDLLATVM